MIAAPPASTPQARRVMQANRGRDTKPELALRSELHRRGARYRVGRRLAFDGGTTRPDIVFGPAQVAVFVDGCFWHRCPEHGTGPRVHRDYWAQKLDRNVQRDARVTSGLQRAGWTVVRVWEHEDPRLAADRVLAALRGSAHAIP